MGVALESCQRHAIRNNMREISAAMLTVVLMSNMSVKPRELI